MVAAVASPTVAAHVSNTSATAALGGDFNTFLKMLTVQMQNQDPMNPIDSADYAVQLATFSGVEQQAKTNQLLEGLNGQFGVLGMSQLAGWVGQQARSAAPAYLADQAVTLSYAAASTADRAVLVVHDVSGNLVSREEVPRSDRSYLWYGGDASGNPLPSGLYHLSLESYAGETLLGTSQVESYSRIVEARGGATGATLMLEGGVEVPATQITALRMS